jgi:hypothetical protein
MISTAPKVNLNPEFEKLISPLPDLLLRLLDLPAVPMSKLPPPGQIPKSGIYWLTEGDRSIYVGRSRRIRERLMEHTRPSSGHNQASFAFRLARRAMNCPDASYTSAGSRSDLLTRPDFLAAFNLAKDRIRAMQVRFVEEKDPVRQCLLEVYVAISVRAEHNDFDSH